MTNKKPGYVKITRESLENCKYLEDKKSVNYEPDEHFDKCECYPERARRCDYCNEHNCCS